MNLKNLLTSSDIRSANCHTAVETTRTQNRRIQNIHTVRGCHYNDSFIDTETIHLNQHLVQCLLSLVVTAAKTGSSLSCHCIYLINKYDTGCVLLSFRKHIPHTGCSDSDKHLDEIRTGQAEEWYSGLSGHCLCKQRLTGSRRSHKDNSLWNAGSKLCILGWICQEIDDLLQLLLLFLESCYILKMLCIWIIRIDPLCTALAKVHHLGIAASLTCCLRRQE